MTDAEKFMDALNQAGYHNITRAEWYKWQADQARTEKLERLYEATKKFHLSDRRECGQETIEAMKGLRHALKDLEAKK